MAYRKAGVLLLDLSSEDSVAPTLFPETPDDGLMQSLDAINARHGRGAVGLGAGRHRSHLAHAPATPVATVHNPLARTGDSALVGKYRRRMLRDTRLCRSHRRNPPGGLVPPRRNKRCTPCRTHAGTPKRPRDLTEPAVKRAAPGPVARSGAPELGEARRGV